MHLRIIWNAKDWSCKKSYQSPPGDIGLYLPDFPATSNPNPLFELKPRSPWTSFNSSARRPRKWHLLADNVVQYSIYIYFFNGDETNYPGIQSYKTNKRPKAGINGRKKQNLKRLAKPFFLRFLPHAFNGLTKINFRNITKIYYFSAI